MKAIVYTQYGSPDVLQLREVETPTPADDEVLIEVYAAGVNTADLYMMRGSPFPVRLMTGGLLKPRNTILGSDVAGRVAAAGRNVTAFRPGDAVFGDLSASGGGGFAEYVRAPASALALKPAGVPFADAAATPMAGVTALQALRDQGNVRPGQKVLINGASGGVGTFAVRIAKVLGAEVTAVCSTRNVDVARSLGADYVIDYTQEDFTRNGQRYELIVAVNGYHPIRDYRRALTANGTYVAVGGSMAQIFQAMLLGPALSWGGRQMRGLSAKPSSRDLAFLGDLLQTKQVTPVVDGCYPLSEVAGALRHLGGRHARGKLVISVKAQT